MEWKIRKRKAHLYHCIRILAARYKKVVEPYEDDIIESENEVFMKH
jgi:Mg2+ and Co2+ transporter CorA